ncbi:MAG TPA: hypothetical protein VFS55_03635 [Dokdonella sp.]|nr:hypothetical protein [Dokdonella sp.]
MVIRFTPFRLLVAATALGMSAAHGELAYVADAANDRVVVIDTAGPTPIDSIAVGHRPIDVIVNPSGTRLYVANEYDDTVSVVETVDRAIIARIPGMTALRGLAMNASGTRLFVAAYDSIHVVDTATNQAVGVPLPLALGQCRYASGKPAVDPPGITVYVPIDDCAYPYSSRGMLAIIDVRDAAAVVNVMVGTGPNSATLDAARNRLYVPNWWDGSMSIIDTRDRSVIATIPFGPNVYPTLAAADPVRPRAYVTDNGAGGVRIIDTADGTISGNPIDVGGGGHSVSRSAKMARSRT